MADYNGAGLAIAPTPDTTQSSEYVPTEAAKKKIAAIEGRFADKEIHKKTYEKTWYISHAAIVGQHYILWNDRTQAFENTAKSPSNRVRYSVPLMTAYWKRTVARLTAHRPGLHVAPAKNDEESAEIARVDLHVLESEFERIGFYDKFVDAAGWAIDSGNCLLGFRWDPWKGPLLTEEQPVLDEFGQPQIDPATGQPLTQSVPVMDEFGRQLRQGEIVEDVISPFEFDIDPRSTSLDDAGWCMRSTIRTLDWVRENYPQLGMYVKAEDVYMNQFYYRRIKQLTGVYGVSAETGGEGDRKAPKNSCIVHEYWERPTQKHSQGQMVVVANGVLLHDGPIPYSKMLEIGIWCPYAHMMEVKIPGRFWGMAMVELAFPLNKNLNRARSQEIENRALHGRPKWLLPKGCGVKEGAFTAEAGEKVTYNPGPRGEKPTQEYPQSTTIPTQNEIAHTMNDIQEVLSWHEANRGIMPSANAPAAAIDKLQQADETALGVTEANFRSAIIRSGKIILALASEFWTEERLVRTTGEDGAIASMSVRGDQLVGNDNADYFDVRVIPQSMMWKDPERQRNMVDGFMKMKVLDPVAHRRIILKMLDAGSIDEIFKDDQLDTSNACRENNLLQQGQPVQARDFENHDIHIQNHNRFRKTSKYRNLDPMIQQMVDQHVAEHEAFMVANAQKQSMMQLQAQAPAIQAQQEKAMAQDGAPTGEEPPAPEPEPEPESASEMSQPAGV